LLVKWGETHHAFGMIAFAVEKYCDEYVCVCVSACLSVRDDISGTTRTIFTKFLCMLPMAVARSSSGDFAIRYDIYVLPVLWMTSCFR